MLTIGLIDVLNLRYIYRIAWKQVVIHENRAFIQFGPRWFKQVT